MKALLPILDKESPIPLYLQLYNYIKEAILQKDIAPNEKLPSLRNLSNQLNLSLTTVEMAYNQLSLEGYIESKPQSGYYINSVFSPEENWKNIEEFDNFFISEERSPYIYDLSCFDFNKWKKSLNKVLTEYTNLLLFEGDPQGEEVLRFEISKYVFQSRGVRCKPSQVVVGAGIQQITSLLSNILKKEEINHIALEEPGYLPVSNIFRDYGFPLTHIDVAEDGICIERLPANIKSAVYVNPSNQFPTGAVMPVGRRYELLSWAKENNSYIIEDDYDSELRYFGKPIPALHGLDSASKVIYLGSFSSTLFSSIKISYMILPPDLARTFEKMRLDYAQTCSKTEQLTLALFMENGHYQTGIKKLRRLYSNKLQATKTALEKSSAISIRNVASGINMIVSLVTDKSCELLCEEAKSLGILTVPLECYTNLASNASLILYYNKLPLESIPELMSKLVNNWVE